MSDSQRIFGDDGRLVLGVNRFWDSSHGPHQVFVSVQVDMLTAIDTTSQTFECRFTVRQQFMISKADSEQLSEQLNVEQNNQFMPEWAPPELAFPQAMDFKILEHGQYKLRLLLGILVVQHETRVHATFAERFELQAFPFDCQDLSIEVRWKVSDEECDILADPSEYDVVSFESSRTALSEWNLHPPVLEFTHAAVMTIDKNLSSLCEYRPKMLLRMKVERVWTAYLYQVFVVMAIITGASLCAFTLSVEDAGDRLAHVTTMFLTAIAFQLIVSSMLPKLNYLTIADKYIFASNVYIISVLFQVAAEAFLISRRFGKIPIWVDSLLLSLNLTVLVLINVTFVLHVTNTVQPRERSKLKLDSADLQDFEDTGTRVRVPSGHLIAHSVKQLPFTDDRTEGTDAVDGGIELCSFHGRWEAPEQQPVDESSISGIYRAQLAHGIEFFAASVFVVSGVEALFLRKITGDPNVPAGRVSMKTMQMPTLGGPEVPGFIQIRNDIHDKNGFTWMPTTVTRPTENEIHSSHFGGRVYIRV